MSRCCLSVSSASRWLRIAFLSFAVSVAPSVFAQEVSETAICFNNADNYQVPRIHMWGAEPAGAIASTNWSGHLMEAVGDFYCYDPAQSVSRINVIFNDNGGAKTGDLTMVSPNACFDSGTWRTLEDCGLTIETIVQPQIAPSNICFDNAGNFNAPTMHMWGSEPSAAVASSNWPGEVMITQGSFVCYDTEADVDRLNVIFSNNGNDKTQNLTMTSPNACYQGGQWKTLGDCGFPVVDPGQEPLANAGDDIEITVGETANFSAASSSDPDGSIVNYQWQSDPAVAVLSLDLGGVSPSFVFDVVGSFDIVLTVTDDSGLQAQDTVRVNVKDLPRPIADSAICFDNPDNYDDPYIYMWAVAPDTFVADVWPGFPMTSEGSYYCYDPQQTITAMNVIFNNHNAPQTDTLIFEAGRQCWDKGSWKPLSECGFASTGQPPQADAGADVDIEVGDSVQFDGSASFDPDGTIETYVWSNGIAGVSGTRTFNEEGAETIILTVTDNDGLTDTDSMVVTVRKKAVVNFPAGKAVFFHNAAAWTNPSAHMWNANPAGSMSGTAWPGLAMTDLGAQDLWYIDIASATVSGEIIFSNNGQDKTDNLAYSGENLCYKNNTWMTLSACGVPEQVQADAGPDRRVNQGARLSLSAAGSIGETEGATWTSSAWTGTLVGKSVVTPELNEIDTYTVTMTLASGEADDFQLTVVAPTRGLAERPLLAAPLGFPISGNVDTGNYVFESAFPNLDGEFVSPLMVTHDGLNPNLIYVVDKPGQLYVFPNDPDVQPSQVQALLPGDFHTKVRDRHEQGLLSVAFHPDFASNRLVYLFYVENTSNESANDSYETEEEPVINGQFDDGIVVRFRLNDAINPTAVEANSEREILRIPSTEADHKGGKMAFHPLTGEFFMGIGEMGYGDSATPNPTVGNGRVNPNAQDKTTLQGSFIRVNMLTGDVPDSETGALYSIPQDNPFVGEGNGVREEIWSYGHRNPWRWAFDTEPDTDELAENAYTIWEAEIGQDGDTRYEEVNIIRKGGNYGWPICEGLRHRGGLGGDHDVTRACSGDLVAPVSGYGNEAGYSIIGGFVYRGDKLPALRGKFIFGDYVEKTLWTIEKGEQKQVLSESFPGSVSSFGTDFSGDEVFISAHGQQFGDPSIIYRVERQDTANAVEIPATLSATGIFADLSAQVPAHGVVEYELNSSAWFDGAQARRFIALPNNQQIDVLPSNQWDLPVGTVLIKHLDLPTGTATREPFETSVLFKQESGEWKAANYEWNASGTDAVLVTQTRIGVAKNQWLAGDMITVQRTVRAGSSCDSCHRESLPRDFEGQQVNRDRDYHGVVDNQVSLMAAIGMLSDGSSVDDGFVDPADTSADLHQRGLVYLDTNCSGCHFGGTDGQSMDYRYETPLADRRLMNVSGRLIPFDHDASRIYHQQTSDSQRMPLGSTLTNPLAESLMRTWIDAAAVEAQGPTAFSLVLSQGNGSAVEVAPGTPLNFTATSTYSNGFELIPQAGVNWSSTNSNVVALSGDSGLVDTVAAEQGETLVSADFAGAADDITVIVNGGPTAPAAFSGAAASSSTINLTWTDRSDNETGFELSRGDSVDGPFSLIDILDANQTSYADSELAPETRYFYELRAVNADGASAPVITNAVTDEVLVTDALEIFPGENLILLEGESRQLVSVATVDGKKVAATLSSTWTTTDANIVAVNSRGAVIGGAVAGSADIRATIDGTSVSITVSNMGAGEYVYFKKPADWDAVNAWVWSLDNGQITSHNINGWPGDAMAPSSVYGGVWFRYPILDSMKGTDDNLVRLLFNCGEGCAKTEDLETSVTGSLWLDDPGTTAWSTTAPVGASVAEGSQVQTQAGEVRLAGSDNLTTLLFPVGGSVELIADELAAGQQFLFWQGPGSELIVDPSSPNTTMVIGGAVSYSVSAISEAVRDDHVEARTTYNDNFLCSRCHGADGATKVGGQSKDLLNISDRFTMAELVDLITTTMPVDAPGSCIGECATGIAEMLLDEAFFPPEGLCDVGDLEPQHRSFRLLSTTEYNNSVRDLFGFELSRPVDVTQSVPSDVRANGYLTNADMFFTSNYAAGYITAAETAADLVGNIYSLASCANGDVDCFLANFAKRAFRRPLDSLEVNALKAVHNAEGDKALLAAVLSSPAMLLRSEMGELISSGPQGDIYQLTDYEIAAFLSYTYWASTPSDEMMALADAGQLHTPQQIEDMLMLMLADPRAEVTFERFVEGWLRLYLSNPVDDSVLSPELKAAMREETINFVRNMVFSGATYEEMMTADYSYMNQALANHYGLTWPGGSGIQQVFYPANTGGSDNPTPNSQRRGLLGHGSILTINSAGTKTHPIKRGLYVRRSLMCQDFGAPPLGAELSPEITPDMTVRMRFEESHQAGPDATPEEIEKKGSCNFCHQHIDGIGFGFENYNHLGLWVTEEQVASGAIVPIDSSGEMGNLDGVETILLDGAPTTSYQGINELADLISTSGHGKACYARQWYRYTRGVHEVAADSCSLNAYGSAYKDDPSASLFQLMIDYTQTSNFSLRK